MFGWLKDIFMKEPPTNEEVLQRLVDKYTRVFPQKELDRYFAFKDANTVEERIQAFRDMDIDYIARTTTNMQNEHLESVLTESKLDFQNEYGTEISVEEVLSEKVFKYLNDDFESLQELEVDILKSLIESGNQINHIPDELLSHVDKLGDNYVSALLKNETLGVPNDTQEAKSDPVADRASIYLYLCDRLPSDSITDLSEKLRDMHDDDINRISSMISDLGDDAFDIAIDLIGIKPDTEIKKPRQLVSNDKCPTTARHM